MIMIVSDICQYIHSLLVYKYTQHINPTIQYILKKQNQILTKLYNMHLQHMSLNQILTKLYNMHLQHISFKQDNFIWVIHSCLNDLSSLKYKNIFLLRCQHKT